ncbi:CRM-domain containing factor CFM3, chloroplastic/mitochondrial [Cocos nucifera]|uniref:CRM-domain containing factor CFM3, chloroplastic/mitochondrial n=1 Tax=Cocos nucifera TaxID=13894 RepID=A0A8K0IAI1_COCNU|nr:CRM-domain containing factor CFM3, chloroplastic/mitochondrial [Cocos nucifera]
MAFPSFVPSKPPVPFSSCASPLLFSPSFLPSLQTRRQFVPSRFELHRLDAYLSSQTLQDPSEESPDADSRSPGVEIKKKKKKRKPRPNFYVQTIERWSLKISSERSRFPWQKLAAEEKKDALQSLIAAPRSSFRVENECLPTDGANSADVQLDSRAKGQRPVEILESDGEKGKSRLDLIVEKLNSSLGDESSHFSDPRSPRNSSGDKDRSNSVGTTSNVALPGNGSNAISRPAGIPQVRGAKLRQAPGHVEPKTQTSVKNSNFNREDDEKLNGSLDNKRCDFLTVGSQSTSSDDEERLNSEVTVWNSALVVDGNHPFSRPAGIPLGSQPVLAPQIHEARPRQTHLDSEARNQTSVKDSEFDCEEEPILGLMDEQLADTSNQDNCNSSQDNILVNSNDDEKPNCIKENFLTNKALTVPLGNIAADTGKQHVNQIPLQRLEFDAVSGKSNVSAIVEKLKSSMDQDSSNPDAIISCGESDDEGVSNTDYYIANLMGLVSFPWEQDGGSSDRKQLHRKSNTELAERTIPEPELRRLREAALRMKERMKVGPAGVTEAVVQSIHEKWKENEVVKLWFEGPPSLCMKRTHEVLESYSKLVTAKSDSDLMTSSANPSEGSTDTSDIDGLLDQLGPRFRDWSGRSPLPVDADLLPGVVPGYKPPFRLLPYKTRSSLREGEMTFLRRLARKMPPHFALGRNRQHQGLAAAMVKLWEKSAIAKIAIKRGVPNTSNERMAEEIKKLTGGILLSRNKEYIVFYRGNDFLTPSVRDVLIEKEKLAAIQQDEEEVARIRASSIVSNANGNKAPLVAGTLAETLEAKIRWGNPLSSEDREKMRKDLDLDKHVSLIRYLQRKLFFAKAKVRKAEGALAKVQEFLKPAELPTDLETVTDEERFLFRKIGLKMRSYLLLGRRGVFDGTIENMHLSWKHRELVKILVKGKTFAQVKHIAISLEAESGGVLISLDKTTKGYAIIIYRGKNYQRPLTLRPNNLLTRRQALARSIELQRREALNHHISNLQDSIQMLKSQLDQMKADKDSGNKDLDLQLNDASFSDDDDDDVEDEGEEAYLETYHSDDEDDDAVSAESLNGNSVFPALDCHLLLGFWSNTTGMVMEFKPAVAMRALVAGGLDIFAKVGAAAAAATAAISGTKREEEDTNKQGAM